MKALKIFTIFALVATFSLVTFSPAWAHCRPGPHPHPHPCHRHHRGHHSDGGAIAGAALGGAALGLVMGSIASQPKQAPQPQVVVVQPNTSDTTSAQQYQALQLERERAKNIALEQELARLRATSGTE